MALVVAAIGVAGLGAMRTIGALVDVHDRYAPLSQPAREAAAGNHEHFDSDAWTFLRDSVHDRERYIIVTRAGATAGQVDRSFVTRTFASYRLLPAIQVTLREEADIAVYLGMRAPRGASCATPARTTCVLRLHP